ncbi:hypothetical protein PFISCL1PPCAC_6785, partial [Pristionchus fissidentatus]
MTRSQHHKLLDNVVSSHSQLMMDGVLEDLVMIPSIGEHLASVLIGDRGGGLIAHIVSHNVISSRGDRVDVLTLVTSVGIDVLTNL